MIKAVIFDLGGVIVLPEVEKIKSYVSNYIGIDYGAFTEFFNKYSSDLTKGKISLIDVYSEAVKHFHLESVTAQNIVDEHLRIFKNVIKVLDEDVISLVEILKKHYVVVCLVNAEIDVVPLVRERGVYAHFQHAYISTELGMEKPDPEIYLTVLKDLHCKSEETVFIDDKEPNVIAARKLGMHSIWYKNYNELSRELKKIKLIF